MKKEEVLRHGWQWADTDNMPSSNMKMIDAEKIPSDIKDVPNDILNYIIASEVSKKPFRIIPQELSFYRKRVLPIPHYHPHERLRALAEHQNPRKLYERTCAKCEAMMLTTYAPDRPAVRGSEEPSGSRRDIVFCDSCYLNTVY